jgi:hypothetical protein
MSIVVISGKYILEGIIGGRAYIFSLVLPIG